MNKKADFEMGKYLAIVEFIKKTHGDKLRAFTYAPYWTHPIRVASLVMKYKKSHKIDELVTAALLHDIVEDTDTSLQVIEDRYGELVRDLVEELTSNQKLQKELGKIQYLSDKMVKMSKWGLVIKLCDRLDNVSDFLFAPDTFIKKYGEETYQILRDLRVKRDERDKNLSDTHYAVMNQIERTLWQYNTIINETEMGE